MRKHHGWTIKNKWGSLLPYFFGYKRKDVIEKLGADIWKEWKKEGHKLVKVRLEEVK